MKLEILSDSVVCSLYNKRYMMNDQGAAMIEKETYRRLFDINANLFMFDRTLDNIWLDNEGMFLNMDCETLNKSGHKGKLFDRVLIELIRSLREWNCTEKYRESHIRYMEALENMGIEGIANEKTRKLAFITLSKLCSLYGKYESSMKYLDESNKIRFTFETRMQNINKDTFEQICDYIDLYSESDKTKIVLIGLKKFKTYAFEKFPLEALYENIETPRCEVDMMDAVMNAAKELQSSDETEEGFLKIMDTWYYSLEHLPDIGYERILYELRTRYPANFPILNIKELEKLLHTYFKHAKGTTKTLADLLACNTCYRDAEYAFLPKISIDCKSKDSLFINARMMHSKYVENVDLLTIVDHIANIFKRLYEWNGTNVKPKPDFRKAMEGHGAIIDMVDSFLNSIVKINLECIESIENENMRAVNQDFWEYIINAISFILEAKECKGISSKKEIIGIYNSTSAYNVPKMIVRTHLDEIMDAVDLSDDEEFAKLMQIISFCDFAEKDALMQRLFERAKQVREDFKIIAELFTDYKHPDTNILTIYKNSFMR